MTVKIVILKERTAKIQLFSTPRKGKSKKKAKVPEPVEGPTNKARRLATLNVKHFDRLNDLN